jgi:RecA-family ATPase
LEQAHHWLQSRGVDLEAFLQGDDAVQIVSGKPNRAKLLYRLPVGVEPLPTKKVTDQGRVMFELRCASGAGASVQDVLPPTIHPQTQQPYAWGGAGSFKRLPVLPPPLLKLWRELMEQPPVTHGAEPLKLYSGWGIPEGGRNDWLFKRAGDMVRQGLPIEALNGALKALNAQRCGPPLDEREVAQIARSATTTSLGAREIAQAAAEVQLLKPVSVADVLTNEAPAPGFVWEGLIPQGVVTLLGAHGGSGKSTVALMLAVCAALGRPLFGVEVRQCKVLFASLEDSAHIVRYRLAGMCRQWGIDPEALAGKLLIVDGTEHPELFVAEGRGEGDLTRSYWELIQLVTAEGVGLAIVDNASDAFAGDENQRRQVRGFMRALTLAAKHTNAGCLLLAHVDKGTTRGTHLKRGEGYSGSTSWHNSARSRLFLSRDENGLLALEHEKSNFGPMREPITLEWPEHGLPRLAHSQDATSLDELSLRQRGRDDDERAIKLLAIIAEFESRGQYCSPIVTARNNVHALLKSEPAYQRLRLNGDGWRRIVNQCQRAKWLEVVDYRTADRKYRQRWGLTQEGRAIARLHHIPSAPSSDESAESAEDAGKARLPRLPP